MEFFAWTLPLLSGASDAMSRSIITVSKKLHTFSLVAGGLFTALPIYCLWLLFTGIPNVGNNFWIAISINLPLTIAALVLMVEAHKSSALAATMPYISLTPAFLLGVTPFMALFFPELEKSVPTFWGTIGVTVLAAGLYILNIQIGHAHLFDPLRAFWKDRGSRFMFFASIIMAFTATSDLIAIRNANTPFYLLVDHSLLVTVLFLLILLYIIVGWKHTLPFSPRGYWVKLIGFGWLTVAGIILNLIAYSLIPVVPYVIAGKRAGAIVFALMLGLFMGVFLNHPDFQDEKKNLKYRLPGTFIAILGMIIIIAWGK